jgi:hypothetical protein
MVLRWKEKKLMQSYACKTMYIRRSPTLEGMCFGGHLPTHHAGWMVGGKETKFHHILVP